MPTKQNEVEYFKSLAFVQRSMIQYAWGVLRRISDKSISDPLDSLVRDEVKHYAALTDILETVLLKDDIQRREFARDNWLGEVRVKRISDGEIFEAHSVNLFGGGMCIEMDEALYNGDELELWFVPYAKKEEHYFKGKVVWQDAVSPERYILGVQFEGETVSD